MIILAIFVILCSALSFMGVVTRSESLTITGILGGLAFLAILVTEALS